MHILFVVPYIPNSIHVRSYNLIRFLAERGNTISTLAIRNEHDDLTDLNRLKQYCNQVISYHLPKWKSYWNCLLALPSSTPLQANYCWHPGLANQVKSLTRDRNHNQKIDIVHIEHLRAVKYGLSHLATNDRVPVVWDSVDCISFLFKQAVRYRKSNFSRYLYLQENNRTELYERKMAQLFDNILVTSGIDQAEFYSLTSSIQTHANIRVVQNGVDLEYFHLSSNVPRDEKSIVIHGKMSYHANVAMVQHFVEDILPGIRARISDVRLYIVGKNPPEVIRQYTKDPNIVVTGSVPDIRPFIQRATLSVAPIKYGAGIQNKILEAMACGTPVVSTPRAIAALDLTPGKDILIGDSIEKLCEHILTLFQNQALRNAIGQAGRAYVEKNHNWVDIARQVEDIYDEIISAKN